MSYKTQEPIGFAQAQSFKVSTVSIMTALGLLPILIALVLLAIFMAGCGSSSMSKTATPLPIAPPVLNEALWIANGTNVVEYIPSQLTTAGSAATAPDLADNSSAFGAPQGVAFDTTGNLWVIDGGTVAAGGTAKPALEEFTPMQLAALHTTPNPMPNVVINSAAFTFPQQAVFDAKGNFWVSDNGANAIYEFTPAQLAATGANVAPNITIKSTPVFSGPLGIAFDAAGDLWIANNASTTIFEFNASTLPTTSGLVTLTPNIVLSDDGKGSIQAPWALVFDTSGNLWSSNANAPNTIVQFAKASLATTGSPMPAVTLSPAMVGTDATLAAPNGIAFDNLGDLSAISSATPFGVGLYGSSQLTAGGAVVPTVFLVGTATTLNAPAGDAFGPVVK